MGGGPSKLSKSTTCTQYLFKLTHTPYRIVVKDRLEVKTIDFPVFTYCRSRFGPPDIYLNNNII